MAQEQTLDRMKETLAADIKQFQDHCAKLFEPAKEAIDKTALKLGYKITPEDRGIRGGYTVVTSQHERSISPISFNHVLTALQTMTPDSVDERIYAHHGYLGNPQDIVVISSGNGNVGDLLNLAAEKLKKDEEDSPTLKDGADAMQKINHSYARLEYKIKAYSEAAAKAEEERTAAAHTGAPTGQPRSQVDRLSRVRSFRGYEER